MQHTLKQARLVEIDCISLLVTFDVAALVDAGLSPPAAGSRNMQQKQFLLGSLKKSEESPVDATDICTVYMVSSSRPVCPCKAYPAKMVASPTKRIMTSGSLGILHFRVCFLRATYAVILDILTFYCWLITIDGKTFMLTIPIIYIMLED